MIVVSFLGLVLIFILSLMLLERVFLFVGLYFSLLFVYFNYIFDFILRILINIVNEVVFIVLFKDFYLVLLFIIGNEVCI